MSTATCTQAATPHDGVQPPPNTDNRKVSRLPCTTGQGPAQRGAVDAEPAGSLGLGHPGGDQLALLGQLLGG